MAALFRWFQFLKPLAATRAGLGSSSRPSPGLQWGGAALAGLAGTAWQLQQATLWAPAVQQGVWAGAVLLAAVAWGWRHTVWAAWVGMLVAALLGAAGTHERAATRLAEALPAALEGVDLVATGSIAELPQPGLQGTRFVFQIDSATRDGQPVQLPRRVSLGWYRAAEPDALLRGPSAELRAGQRWQLTLRLQRPHGLMNPHGFDLELWLFERGIRASGSVRAVPGAVNELLAEAAAHPLQQARQALRDALYRQVPDAGTAGVLAALVLGDQAAILREDWALFRDTGIAHLMAISGLHVTMFAWGAGLLVGWLWRRSPRAMLRLPAPQAARWGGLLLATAYALLAGWGVPAQRTVAMLAVVVLLRSLGLRWPASGVLLAAAVAVALGDPWALLQPGFWLSFVAVGLLMVSDPAPAGPTGASAWARLAAAARAGVRTQAVATLGLAPLSLLFFQQLSVVGFVANLLAIPLVTLLITPLALAGALLPPLWTLAGALLEALAAVLQPLAALPWAVWTVPAAPGWAQAAGLAGGLLAVMPLPWRLRLCGVLLLGPLLLPAVPRPAPGSFELVAADVGQGTAVLVRTHRHLLVYDTGPPFGPADSAATDAGERVLLPLLRARGERRIDLLMLSHRDSDHVGGAASLMAALPVRAISSSLPAGHPLLQQGVPAQPCQAGQRWVWDGVRFDVLHPPAGAGPSRRANADSCVLRLSAPGRSVLLTGDIEAEQEAALVRALGPALASQVLLVPHHGSRTSSTAPFLEAVAPQVALVQAAYRSRFGHPAAEVEQRYLQRGLQWVRSDRCGAWTLPAAGPGRCVRREQARYWHHPDGRVAADQARD
jgi:competence protein ComEC